MKGKDFGTICHISSVPEALAGFPPQQPPWPPADAKAGVSWETWTTSPKVLFYSAHGDSH